MTSGDRPHRDVLFATEPTDAPTLVGPVDPETHVHAPATAGALLATTGLATTGPATTGTGEPGTTDVAAPIAVAPAAPPRPAVFRSPADAEPSAWHPFERLKAAIANATKIGLVVLLAYGLMFNFSVVRGSSMAPSIHDGDRILVDHLSFLLQGVKRGDIVVLQYPLDPAVDYIKRVIGLPGDEILIDGGRVYVNGELLAEPYVATPDDGVRHSVRVLPEHYFVLGDNRPHSSDSREFGQVHRDLLRGRVDVRVWPFERAGRID